MHLLGNRKATLKSSLPCFDQHPLLLSQRQEKFLEIEMGRVRERVENQQQILTQKQNDGGELGVRKWK